MYFRSKADIGHLLHTCRCVRCVTLQSNLHAFRKQACLARTGFRGAKTAMGLVSLYQGTLSVLVLLSLDVQG